MVHLPLILSGAMASSAVSSVLYLREAAGNYAETRTGVNINYGDAACFHEHGYALLVKLVINTFEAMSKVCDGLRGDVFVAALEVGFDGLCQIADGRPRGIDTLINHMRGIVFSLDILPSWRTLVQAKRERV